jgi:nucleoside-diphosphate-sugar epimerase
MRCATAYGLSPRLRADLLHNDLVCWAHTTGRIRIANDGASWRPVVHVQDIARAFAAALAAPREAIHNQAFNVGANGENYQIRELAEIVRDTVAGCSVHYAEQTGPDPRSYRVDFGKFAGAFSDAGLDWTAERGAEELLAAYRAAGMTFEDFDGHRFTRLKHLRERIGRGELDDELRPR